MEVPKVSRDSAPQRQDAGPVVDLRDELDGYTFAGLSGLEIDTSAGTFSLVPDVRYGHGFLISRESRLQALVEGVNCLSRLRAERAP
jgi:hypothetical protein